MADKDLAMTMPQYSLRSPHASEWDAVARMIANAIPTYLVSQLGVRFSSLYYRHLTAHPGTCSLAAYDERGNLAGFVLGCADSQGAKQLRLPVVARLLLAANYRLVSPAFLSWLVRGVLNLMQPKDIVPQKPKAELVILVVAETFQGQGLAPLLIAELEDFFRRKKLKKIYFILTEKANKASNRFYEKIGAHFVLTRVHHGREINEWHKSFP